MNLFGTDGIRNRVGIDPFTPKSLPLFGQALGQWAQEKYGTQASFLVAGDTRYSGSWIKASLMSGLLRHPITAYDTGILPTPAVFHLMKNNPQFTCGLIITASHNAAEDNGMKIIDTFGKLSKKDEERITTLFKIYTSTLKKECSLSFLGNEIPFLEAQYQYTKRITAFFDTHFLHGKTIVLDCAHGASYHIAPTLFSNLGARVIALNTQPNGYNINKHCGAIAPQELQEAVLKHKAFIGFAFDGDADRVIAISKNGTYKNGDDLLALLSTHSDYKNQTHMVSTIMTNKGLEDHLAAEGKQLIRTSVGDTHILQALTEKQALLGGEPSGHIILKNIIDTSDGILVALKVLETIFQTGNETLKSFTHYPHICLSIPVTHKKDLHAPPVARIINSSKKKLTSGRLVVRYSGTEPVVRIMAEGSDQDSITHIAHALAKQLEDILI